MRARHALLLASLFVETGCGASAPFTSPSDWAAYRATRVSPTLEGRLAAQARYLAERPTGAFAEEVVATFRGTEGVYYAHKRGSRRGLEAYLRVLPQGPHHTEATQRLKELEARERHADEELKAATMEAQERGAGPDTARRDAVRATFERWLRAALDPALWDDSAEARPDALALLVGSPPYRCEPPVREEPTERCTNKTELAFAVRAGGRAIARTAAFEVTVARDASGRIVQAILSGLDLFSRLEEANRVVPIEPGDERLRAAALERIRSLVRRVFGEQIGTSPECEHSASPPVVIDLSCSGLHVAATTIVNERDQILVARRAHSVP